LDPCGLPFCVTDSTLHNAYNNNVKNNLQIVG